MTFPERAVMTCVAQMKDCRVSERRVRDILKCVKVDVSPVEVFLQHEHPEVRMAAVRIVGEKGNADRLIDVVRNEMDKSVLFEAMKQLGKRGRNLQDLVGLLETSDSLVKQEAIAMFRKSGNVDCLFSLLFDANPNIVSQVKEYFDELQRKHS